MSAGNHFIILILFVLLYAWVNGIERLSPPGKPGNPGIPGDSGPIGKTLSVDLKEIVTFAIIETWKKYTDLPLTNIEDCFLRDKCQAKWTSWSSWSECSKTCGKDGIQFQKRTCLRKGRQLQEEDLSKPTTMSKPNLCSSFAPEFRYVNCLPLPGCSNNIDDNVRRFFPLSLSSNRSEREVQASGKVLFVPKLQDTGHKFIGQLMDLDNPKRNCSSIDMDFGLPLNTAIKRQKLLEVGFDGSGSLVTFRVHYDLITNAIQVLVYTNGPKVIQKIQLNYFWQDIFDNELDFTEHLSSVVMSNGHLVVSGGRNFLNGRISRQVIGIEPTKSAKKLTPLPVPVIGDCKLALNQSTIILIGGQIDNESMTDHMFFYDFLTDTYTAGPRMSVKRNNLECGVLTKHDGTKIVMALGGKVANDMDSPVFEYLDLRVAPLRWTVGSKLDLKISGGTMVQYGESLFYFNEKHGGIVYEIQCQHGQCFLLKHEEFATKILETPFKAIKLK